MPADSGAFTLILEPTRQCNLRCMYCYSDCASAGIMSGRTLRRAIESGVRYAEQRGFGQINVLWHGGEPLLAGLPFFRLATEIANGVSSTLSFHHFIQTNGLALDTDFCSFFRDHGFQIGLSLDGPSDLHDRMRIFPDGRGTHGLILKRLSLLEKHGLTMGFNAVVTRHSLGQEERLYRFFQDLGYGFRVNPVIPGMIGKSAPYLLQPGEYGQFLCALFQRWTATESRRIRVSPLDRYLKALLGGVPHECQQRSTCAGLQIGVKPSGDVLLCSRFDAPVLGNIHGMEIEEMLGAEWCKEIEQRSEKLSSCRSCPFWNICHGGCPHNALVFCGNQMKKDPFCKDYQLIFGTLGRVLEDLRRK